MPKASKAGAVRGNTKMSERIRTRLLIPIGTLILIAVVLWGLTPQGMWPHDEGQYGQSAVRILNGELPHRDFHEMYTGLLSYFNALLFWCAGNQLIVLRRALVLASLPAAWAMYDLIWRMTDRAMVAASVTFASFVISVGMTHAASPTLYLSFLTILVTWFLVKDAQSPNWIWVVSAGICCALAVAVKVTGLYTVATAALILTYRGNDVPVAGTNHFAATRERFFRIAVASIAAVSGLLLLWSRLSLVNAVYFWAPIACCAISLVDSGRRFRIVPMLGRYLIFAASVTLPSLLMLIPWIRANALHDFYRGVFVLPKMRLESAAYEPPSLSLLAVAIPVCLCCVYVRGIWFSRLCWIGMAILTAILINSLIDPPMSGFVSTRFTTAMASWQWVLPLIWPLLVWALHVVSQRQQLLATQTFAVGVAAAFFCLNQFPFTHPIYFLFCFPLIALAATGLACSTGVWRAEVTNRQPQPGSLASCASATVAFCFFCLLRFGFDGVFAEAPQTAVDSGKYGNLSGLLVPIATAENYRNIKAILDQALPKDQAIVAGPDCPEIYFFSDRQNLTAVMYEVFTNPQDYGQQLLKLADRDDVGAIIMNRDPFFSKPWSREFVQKLVSRFPGYTTAGQFVVFVRSTPQQK